jgi:nitrite reductase/ring-hydroxylating ferredoxin subunit
MLCCIVVELDFQIMERSRNDSIAPARRPTIDVAARTLPCSAVAAARDGERDVVVVRSASGRLYVVDDICPHDGGHLADGYVEGERVLCSRHNWEFELSTGLCPYAPQRSITTVALPTRRPASTKR